MYCDGGKAFFVKPRPLAVAKPQRKGKRRCVACGTYASPKGLLRLRVLPQVGRSAYVCPSLHCAQVALSQGAKRLRSALRQAPSKQHLAELEALQRRCPHVLN